MTNAPRINSARRNAVWAYPRPAPPRFPGAPEVVETARSHEPPDLFGLPAGADVSIEIYGGACSLRLDGRRNRVYVGRFEFAAFASYEEARYAFTRLWREVEKRSDMELHTRRLVPMAFVADVPLSIGYYGALGFGVENTFTPPEADAPVWAWLESGDARLMVSKASDPVIPEAQAVLFYLYTDDVASAREELAARGFEPGPISTPFYAPGGEFRLTDPDGYVLMVTHV